MRLATLADGRPARIEADRCYPLPGTLVDHLCRAPSSPIGKGLALENAAFGPPVRRPGKIICIGLNYLDHARETNAEPPTSRCCSRSRRAA